MAFTLVALDERRYTEQIRMMFLETGLKYDEEIVDVATQKRMHDDGELEFNKLPLLRVGKFTLGESAAIIEHIAVLADKAKAGRGNTYLGDGEAERSLARSLVAGANELRRQFYEEYTDEGPKQDQAKFTSQTLPGWMSHLNRLATATESDDLGLGPGIHFTFGDISMFEANNQIASVLGDDFLDDYREIKAYYLKVATRPRLRMYLDNRPQR